MNKTRDLTQGSPTKLILGFFFPLLFGIAFQQVYNMVDTIIVGRCLGVQALAGVGATGSLNFLVLGFALGVGFAVWFDRHTARQGETVYTITGYAPGQGHG